MNTLDSAEATPTSPNEDYSTVLVLQQENVSEVFSTAANPVYESMDDPGNEEF